MWHGDRLAAPSPFMDYRKRQKHLWKLAAAKSPIKIWNGTYLKDENYTLSFQTVDKDYIQACVRDPYVLVVGSLKLDMFQKELFCTNCRLYTCLNCNINTDQSINLISMKASWNMDTR